MVEEKLNTEESEKWYSSVDMTYACGQVPSHQLTAKPVQVSNYRRIHRIVQICYGILCHQNFKTKSNGHFSSEIRRSIRFYR